MKKLLGAALLMLLAAPPAAVAQSNLQLWGDVVVEKPRTHRLVFTLDIEPKVLVEAPDGAPGWWCLDVLPGADYVVNNWLDVSGELTAGYTKQTNDLNSVELTARGGMRVHLTSRDLRVTSRGLPGREKPSKRRVVVRDYFRIEERNFFYNTDKPSSSTWRVRNRVEFQYPLNKERTSMDGARYLTSDWEWFVPIGDPNERFANSQRIRAGLGYRRDARLRVEALYVWNRTRNTAEAGFTTNGHTLDVRLVWIHR
jgi:opacity protein-like surface antigen